MSVHRPLRAVPLAAALVLGLSSVEAAFGDELLVGQAAALGTMIGPNGKLLR